MAISFNQQKGSAQKTSIKSFQYVNGDNKMRLCGDILARYVYWIKGQNDKSVYHLIVILSLSITKRKTGFVSTTLISSVAGAMPLSVLTTVK